MSWGASELKARREELSEAEIGVAWADGNETDAKRQYDDIKETDRASVLAAEVSPPNLRLSGLVRPILYTGGGG